MVYAKRYIRIIVMAISYNSKIVTNGLVLCLDAANPRSYPGTGTNWFDVSGLGNHHTIIGSPTVTVDLH
jgi:hypothetical protein